MYDKKKKTFLWKDKNVVCEGQMNISSANALVMLLFSEC